MASKGQINHKSAYFRVFGHAIIDIRIGKKDEYGKYIAKPEPADSLPAGNLTALLTAGSGVSVYCVMLCVMITHV